MTAMGDTEPNATPAANADPAGQQPTMIPATTPTTTSASTTEPQTPAASDGQQQQQPSTTDVQNPEAKRYADEAARYRKELRDAQKRLTDLEAERQKAEDAKLSKEQRLEKQVAEYQAKEAQATLATQERIVRAEVRAEAISKGINPQLAARLIDFAAIVYDDATGDPTNIGDLLTKALTEYGIPAAAATGAGAASQQQQTGQQQPNIGATNAQRQSGPVVITANQYLDPAFRKDFAAKNGGMDLLRAVNAGKVKIV